MTTCDACGRRNNIGSPHVFYTASGPKDALTGIRRHDCIVCGTCRRKHRTIVTLNTVVVTVWLLFGLNILVNWVSSLRPDGAGGQALSFFGIGVLIAIGASVHALSSPIIKLHKRAIDGRNEEYAARFHERIPESYKALTEGEYGLIPEPWRSSHLSVPEIKCPSCQTVYNRDEVVKQIRQKSPEAFDFTVSSTKFRCIKCGNVVTMTLSSGVKTGVA